MKRLSRVTSIAAISAAALSSVALPASAQTFAVVKAFGTGTDVQSPRGTLAQGQDGILYGTTLKGGSTGDGAAFALTLGGDESIVAGFASGATGTTCNTGLNLGRDGSFYGTCSGETTPFENGTVFSVAPHGNIKTLHTFNGTDGKIPEPGRPMQSLNGDFYGMTESGGANGHGTAYMIAADGQLTTLHDFGGAGGGDGSDPSGALTLASDGNFYGTTLNGGALGGGTVFKMTPAGALTILHSFPNTGKKEGRQPTGGVVQGNDGKFYGVTFGGGAEDRGTVYVLKQDGSAKTVHSFSAAENLANPCEGLAISAERSMYGIAAACKNGKCGESGIFEVTAKGQFKSLHNFVPGTDGTMASGGLLLNTNGILYGLTEAGGPNGGGTAYSLNVGIAPFVRTSPSSGAIDDTIQIYGQGFTQKGTKVSISGVKAKMTFVTANYIQFVVPAGATSGPVTVKTPSGKLKSIDSFVVSP